MCVPLGHRNGKSRREWIVPSKRITKAEVDAIIDKGNYECLYWHQDNAKFVQYEGDKDSLNKILHSGKTKVKIAGSRTLGYACGYDTVVMDAPSHDFTILIRVLPYYK